MGPAAAKWTDISPAQGGIKLSSLRRSDSKNDDYNDERDAKEVDKILNGAHTTRPFSAAVLNGATGVMPPIFNWLSRMDSGQKSGEQFHEKHVRVTVSENGLKVAGG
jgi:hypothetical protein